MLLIFILKHHFIIPKNQKWTLSTGYYNKSSIDTLLLNYYTKSETNTVFNAKQATTTGGASSITDTKLTASKAVISNAIGKVAVSSVGETELGYSSGVTSATQTQFTNFNTSITA